MLRKFPILLLLVPLVALIVCADRRDWHAFSGTPVALDTMPQTCYAVAESYPKSCPKSFRIEVEVLPSKQHAYLYLQKDSARSLPGLGDTLLVRTRFKQGGVIGQFDYGKYLRRNGIAGTAYVRSRDWKITGEAVSVPLHLRPLRWQRALYERYKEAGLTSDILATTAALTLGYKDDLDPQLKSHFQKSGAAHVLAVSGLHTGILYGVLFFLLTCFGLYPPLYDAHRHQRIVSGLIVVCLIGYALLTGSSPSVVRSVLFISIIELGKVWHRQPFSLNTLFVTAFLILFFRPHDLFSVSFQLSFAAVLGILVFEPALRRLFPLPARRRGFKDRVAEYLRGLLTVSVSAQVFTLPLSLHYFSQTSNLFFLTNLMVIPLAFLLMVSGLLLLAFGWLPVAGSVSAFVTSRIAAAMNAATEWVEHLPHSVTHAELSLPYMAGMCLIILMFAILLNRVTR